MWVEKCDEYSLPQRYNFESVLGEPVEIQDWASKGLPNDSVSIANGIITKYCKSFPLFIDP